MNQAMLEVARHNLRPFMPGGDGPEAMMFGVPLSLLGRDELIAVVNFQAHQHKAERARLIAERNALLDRQRPSFFEWLRLAWK